ncbi:MAG: bifunctional 2-C-methyl-D-erythritol 4-phosphate cytidylyltransferase/2-C-methyl-D-erythritol 2,4-cyclodiphosphate synthase [Rhodospirillaceae bacterium]
MPECAALVVAAGRGMRFGSELPKQYTDLGGYPVLYHCLKTLSQHPGIDSVTTVIQEEDRCLYDQVAQGLDIRDPVQGGLTRQESVRNGLDALSGDNPTHVLIHDGARPNINDSLIDRILDTLKNGAEGVIPILAVSDTLQRIGSDLAIIETINRDGIVQAQTPQGFSFQKLLNAHSSAIDQDFTDDASVFQSAGHQVLTIKGNPGNIKLTDKSDFITLTSLLYETRIGTGFDVHRFQPGKHIILGGISIPFEKSLAGHSDADVILHAATDAILGAIGDGDIGIHFPPGDATHKNAASEKFLRFAISRLYKKQGKLIYLDITVICEEPKLAPHRNIIRARIAEYAEVSVDRVNLKATTTEGLGFTGRSEGIACQVTATVQVIP